MSRSSSDDGGDGGGVDTDACRSDDDRSLSCGDDYSVGGGGDRDRDVGSVDSRSNSANNSNNNNNDDDEDDEDGNGKDKSRTAAANGTPIGDAVVRGDSGFSFFELPGNAAAMPYNLEVRDAGAGGVWTKTQLPKGVKYGPFLGKWGPKPMDSRFAWEVRVAGYSGYLDGTIEICNWMKFIRSTQDGSRQNVRAFLLAGQIFYELTQTVRHSEELLLGKKEPLNLDAAFGELMAASEDRSERDSVVASQNSLGSIDGDADVDGDAEEPDEDDQNRCILCEKCFPDIEQLDDHLVSGHQYRANQYDCELCPQSYSWKPCLIRHLALAHSRKFTCETCSKVFSDPSNLQRHIRTNHAGARSHACSECGKTFATSSGLKQHTHIHSSVKPFQCEVCFKAYTQFSNLCRHKRMHADCRMQVKCDRCDQSFSTGTSLSKHKRFCESNGSTSLQPSSSSGSGTPAAPSQHQQQHTGSSPPSPFPMFPRFPLYSTPYHPFFYPPANGTLPAHMFTSPFGPFGQFAPKMMQDVQLLQSLRPGGLHDQICNSRFKRAGETAEHNETPAKRPAPPGNFGPQQHHKTPPSMQQQQQLMGTSKTSPLVGEEASSNQRPSPARPGVTTYAEPKVRRAAVKRERSPAGPCDLSVNCTDIEAAGRRRQRSESPADTVADVKPSSDQPLDLSVTRDERRKSPAAIEPAAVVRSARSPPARGACDRDEPPAVRPQRHEHRNGKWSRSPGTPSPSSPYSVSSLMQAAHPKPLYIDPLYPSPLQSSYADSQQQLHHHQPFVGGGAAAQAARPFPYIVPAPSPVIEHFLRQPVAGYPKAYQDIINQHHHQQQQQQHGHRQQHQHQQQQHSGVAVKSKDRYACKYCGKVFPRSANLTRHVRTHTGEQPYRCAHCERSFSISSNLQRHVRNIHRQERNFKCALCNRRFSQQTNLDRHVKKHEAAAADDGTAVGAVTSSSASSADDKEDPRLFEIRSFMKKVTDGAAAAAAELQNNNVVVVDSSCLPTGDGLRYAAPL